MFAFPIVRLGEALGAPDFLQNTVVTFVVPIVLMFLTLLQLEALLRWVGRHFEALVWHIELTDRELRIVHPGKGVTFPIDASLRLGVHTSDHGTMLTLENGGAAFVIRGDRWIAAPLEDVGDRLRVGPEPREPPGDEVYLDHGELPELLVALREAMVKIEADVAPR